MVQIEVRAPVVPPRNVFCLFKRPTREKVCHFILTVFVWNGSGDITDRSKAKQAVGLIGLVSCRRRVGSDQRAGYPQREIGCSLQGGPHMAHELPESEPSLHGAVIYTTRPQ